MKKSVIMLPVAAAMVFACLAACNRPPVINELRTFPEEDTLVSAGDTVKIICSAEDPGIGGPEVVAGTEGLDFTWEAPDGGKLSEVPSSFPNDDHRYWESPDEAGDYRIVCTVADDNGATDSDTLTIGVELE